MWASLSTSPPLHTALRRPQVGQEEQVVQVARRFARRCDAYRPRAHGKILVSRCESGSMLDFEVSLFVSLPLVELSLPTTHRALTSYNS